MKIAASVLDCKDRIEGVLDLNSTNISYVHIDVMDGKFVPSIHFENVEEIQRISEVSGKKLDVHLMMENPFDYVKQLAGLNIEFITIHLEIVKDKKVLFKQIRDLGYKVGLSIKPGTDVKEVEPYLSDVDMVLVMSVEPGLGGQKFIDSTVDRIGELRELIKKSGRDILIEVDGGINNETIGKIKDIDIAVVGSYITKSDNYYNRVENLLKVIIGDMDDKDKKLSANDIKKKKMLYRGLLGIGLLPFILLLIGAFVLSFSG